MINGNAVGGIVGYGKTFILTDENGNELTGVVVDEEVVFTADPITDIREGKIAATEQGVVVGQKDIPAYHTTQGHKIIPNGSEFVLYIPNYDYTKLQAIICSFNTSADYSVSAEQVVINDSLYNVQSTAAISVVQKDDSNACINFGFTNTSGSHCLLRYFTYKEIY